MEPCGRGLTVSNSIILKIIEPIELNGDRGEEEPF